MSSDLYEIKPLFENGFSYLLVSDFDQTLRFIDSGCVLWDRLTFCEISMLGCLRN